MVEMEEEEKGNNGRIGRVFRDGVEEGVISFIIVGEESIV